MAWPAYWVDEIQWFTLVTLFVAALVTLAIYLVQYALVALRNSRRKPPSSDELLQGNDTLLAWVLSLNSWRTQWQKAWITALNAEAKVRGDSLLLTFEEDTTPQPLELAVRRVVSVVKSAQEKVVSCNVVGDSIQFIVHVSHTSPTTTECQSYSVKLSPLHLQLELSLKEKGEDIEVVWSFLNASETNIKIQPTAVQEGQMAETCAIFEPFRDVFQNLISLVSPSVILSTKPTDIIKEVQWSRQKGVSYLLKRYRLIDDLRSTVGYLFLSFPNTGSINPVCVTQLNDPLQKFSSSVAKNGTNLSWKEEFIFELNAKSKELQLQILEDGKLDSSFSAWATVPLDLFRKQPSGQQSFALTSRPSGHSPVLGSVTAEFSYVEPNESKSWQVPAQLPATKIEKDRTVMPCGTVVTTVTAVKTKPRLEGKHSALSPDSPVKTHAKEKMIEKDFSVQAIHCQGAPVSKVLSSSDTELLVLNGTDPVAEAAIRQLSESAKQKLKSPRKKSTIIISGVSKTSLSQDSEAALMMDYAAAMDDSCKEEAPSMVGDSTTEVPNKKLPLAASQMLPATDPEENSHNAWDLDNSSQQWTSNALLDQDCEEMSGSSLSVSESGSVKKSKGGILKKSAKLFFRRRHHQKDPGMSQSHNDLVYLQQPTSDETRRKGATLTRILHKKILSKNKSKNKLNGTSMEPCV
uniref:C2 domain-containing protein n=1 Tax=Terrapene triunguis TaxID=2587831 RepID=A0A674K813_9SAUR